MSQLITHLDLDWFLLTHQDVINQILRAASLQAISQVSFDVYASMCHRIREAAVSPVEATSKWESIWLQPLLNVLVAAEQVTIKTFLHDWYVYSSMTFFANVALTF